MIILETQSLCLREFRAADVNRLIELNSNPEVLRFVLHPAPWKLEDAIKFIQYTKELYDCYGYGRWAVTEKDSDEVIGWCGLKYKPEFRHVDLGYRFMPQFWGKGYATQAASACLDHGFSELGLERIVASYVPGNSASLQVLQKNGMKHCGELIMAGKKYPLLEKFNLEDKNKIIATPFIETERLLLRKMHLADTRVLFALNSDPEVVMYTGDKPFSSLNVAKDFFAERINAYEKAGYGRWIVILKDTGETLGWCGLKFEEEMNAVDLGYRFFRRHWGKGYATEAAKACLDYGFNTLKLEKIVARAMKLNVASVKVLEKCGMRFVGEKEFALHEGVEYALHGSEFDQGKGNQ